MRRNRCFPHVFALELTTRRIDAKRLRLDPRCSTVILVRAGASRSPGRLYNTYVKILSNLGTFVYFVSLCVCNFFLFFATIFKEETAACCVLLLYLSFSIKLETITLLLKYVLHTSEKKTKEEEEERKNV